MGNITKPKHPNVNNINRQLKLVNSQLAEIKASANKAKKFFNNSRNKFKRTGVANQEELQVVMLLPQYMLELLDEKKELEQLRANLTYAKKLHTLRLY
jgi:predicted transposase YbfD/YdcC